ncbi:hypothetical protein, partial [Hominenteromicrobium sp.]|uniref:hypothetical protein n=1 Tax=Hominenteromicrobium sp. TaxID=3073581 RepID=UPI003AF05204
GFLSAPPTRKTKGLTACNSQTASPFGCLNNSYFKILSNFLGSLHMPAGDLFAIKTKLNVK